MEYNNKNVWNRNSGESIRRTENITYLNRAVTVTERRFKFPL